MTRPTKTGDKAKGQTPRNQPDPPTVEGIHHDHHDDDGRIVESHLHRLGNLRHLHTDDGHVEFADGRPPELIQTDPPRDPATAQEDGPEWFNGDNKAEPQSVTADQAREALANQAPPGPLLADVRDQARSQGVVRQGVDDDDRRDLERLRNHPDVAVNGPRPVSVSGAPGSRLSDVASRAIHLTMDGYPATVHDEVIWTEIATHALVSMREEQARTKGPADPALIAAALDAVDHIARARGLVRGTGAGS